MKFIDLAGPMGRVIATGVLLALPAAAQETRARPGVETAAELTPQEQRERNSRKDCKVAICAVLHNRAPAGGEIACNILKSWRKEQLSKLIEKAKITWPWGAVRCVVDLKLERDALIKAMTETKYELTLGRHHASCDVDRQPEPSASITFDFTPMVTFENGKAVKAALNWGKVEAPSLVKGAIWTATATDNAFNVLRSTIVDDVNDFVDAKCMEVQGDWAK